jgi:hypothetical protein
MGLLSDADCRIVSCRPTEHGAHVALVLEKYFSHDGLEDVKQATDILGYVNSSILFGFPIAGKEGFPTVSSNRL